MDIYTKILKELKDELKDAMPDQRSTLDQLVDIHRLANALKMYDAAVVLDRIITN